MCIHYIIDTLYNICINDIFIVLIKLLELLKYPSKYSTENNKILFPIANINFILIEIHQRKRDVICAFCRCRSNLL